MLLLFFNQSSSGGPPPPPPVYPEIAFFLGFGFTQVFTSDFGYTQAAFLDTGNLA